MGGAKYQTWLEKMKAAGKALASYGCPSCGGVIHSLRPQQGDTYDTAVSCPFCNRLHFRVVESSGKVTVEDIDVKEVA